MELLNKFMDPVSSSTMTLLWKLRLLCLTYYRPKWAWKSSVQYALISPMMFFWYKSAGRACRHLKTPWNLFRRSTKTFWAVIETAPSKKHTGQYGFRSRPCGFYLKKRSVTACTNWSFALSIFGHILRVVAMWIRYAFHIWCAAMQVANLFVIAFLVYISTSDSVSINLSQSETSYPILWSTTFFGIDCSTTVYYRLHTPCRTQSVTWWYQKCRKFNAYKYWRNKWWQMCSF